jgi:hypothetical protein
MCHPGGEHQMSFLLTSQVKLTLSINALEKVVAMDPEQNAFKDNLMHEDQFGFVKGRSTEHALSATLNEIEKGLHEK